MVDGGWCMEEGLGVADGWWVAERVLMPHAAWTIAPPRPPTSSRSISVPGKLREPSAARRPELLPTAAIAAATLRNRS
jgi:hypothetical protein